MEKTETLCDEVQAKLLSRYNLTIYVGYFSDSYLVIHVSETGFKNIYVNFERVKSIDVIFKMCCREIEHQNKERILIKKS